MTEQSTEQNTGTLAKVYEPGPVESKWWVQWEAAKLFTPSDDPGKIPTYCIVIPPPNVTGSLHMGHALNNTLQDILIRYHRMQGQAALWVFGMDHAGIATQNVVERQLKAEGKSRHDLGREAFIKKVWQWKEASGGTIRHQLKKLGCSLDYSHERFTMDEGLSRAVKEVFIRLFEEGKIYRAQRLINWCPRCHTALSDLEVEHEEINGHLWHIRYPLEADPQDGIIVATTRPETLLGDTAVAVHPDDKRYRKWIGKRVVVPFVDRLIPIIADAMVDKDFGSGAVKITPAHDFNDFETGERHGLERINVLTEDARMNEAAGPFQGLDRFEARDKIVKALEDQGLLVKIEDHKTSIGHCYRCKTIVEPYLSMQWFVKTKELAAEATKAVKKGKTKIIPTQWENTYFRWMEDIKDWCISRQIWWGHRIPVWYCGRCADAEVKGGGVYTSRTDLKNCPKCGHNDLRQESDVLDTWFSSALWPFSTLGWPDKTPRLKNYYPTTTLVTGFDIIFFWVARMMMMGIHFTGDVPFKTVYIHALVRDAEGQKMSKSKGNVIDPLEVMESHGTDAFRFTLAAFAAQGRDIKLSEERVIGYRNFCNKIWNAARFILPNVPENLSLIDDWKNITNVANHDVSRWIIYHLSETIEITRKYLDDFRFNDAALSLYHFFWGIFCDWFIEFIKAALKSTEPNDQKLKLEFSQIALFVLDQALRLLHPFMPFMTEELWSYLPRKEGNFLAVAQFPEPLKVNDKVKLKASMNRIEVLTAIVEKVRQIRMETGVPLNKKLDAIFYIENEKISEELNEIAGGILYWAGLNSFEFSNDKNDPRITKGMARGVTRFPGVIAYVALQGIVDLNKERSRQFKEKEKLEKGLGVNQNKLKDQKFLKNAPQEVVAEIEEKVREYQQKIDEVEEALKYL